MILIHLLWDFYFIFPSIIQITDLLLNLSFILDPFRPLYFVSLPYIVFTLKRFQPLYPLFFTYLKQTNKFSTHSKQQLLP